MPRIPRLFLPGHPMHVVQRGHNRAQVFFGQDDAKFYLGWLRGRRGRATAWRCTLTC